MDSWTDAPWVQETVVVLRDHVPTVLVALGIVIGGWLAAFILQRATYVALQRTTIDDKIATMMGLHPGDEGGARIERVVAKAVYYVVLAAVVVMLFDYLKVEAVTLPLVALMSGLAGAVPNLLKALLFGVGGYVLARIVRRLLVLFFDKTQFDKRVAKYSGGLDEQEQREAKKKGKKVDAPIPFSKTVGEVAYWFILIVTAIPVMESLQISALAEPLSNALGILTSFLPKLGAAAVLLLIGYVAARAVRGLVSGVLSKIGVDRVVTRLGFGAALRQNPLSSVAGTIAMVFVFLQFAIAAVGRLELAEISGPLSIMLAQVYAYLPKLFVGAVVLAIGVVLARVTANLTARLFAAVGFNSFVAHLGLVKDETVGRKQEEESRRVVEEGLRDLETTPEDKTEVSDAGPASADALLAKRGSSGIKTPADIAGAAASVVVILLFLKQTLATLELTSLSGMLDRLVQFLPHLLAALVVLGAGLWAGAWAHRRIGEVLGGSSDRLLRLLGPIAHGAIVTFAAMVAVQQLGVGTQLIAIAFAVILGALCLALALAFGLGGREVAGKIVAQEYDKRRTASKS